MKTIFFLFFYSFFVNSLKIDNYVNFLKKKAIYGILDKLILSNTKEPIILNGNKSPFKKDICKYISDINNVAFKEYRFDSFMLEFPHVHNENSLIYVNDFLVGNGRIFNHYEENVISNLNKNSNLIVFQSDNIDTIAFKDANIIRKFMTINFPEITKKEIVQYIYDTITINNYDSNLYCINWIKYNIQNLGFEKIDKLLKNTNTMFKQDLDFKFILNNIDNIIDNITDI